MKSELGIRPLYHQLGHSRRGPHFSCLPRLLPVDYAEESVASSRSGTHTQSGLEKLATIQMLDVWLPTTDGRWLVMPRFTQPERTRRSCYTNSSSICHSNRRRESKLESPNFPKKLFGCSADLFDRFVEDQGLSLVMQPYCERQAKIAE